MADISAPGIKKFPPGSTSLTIGTVIAGVGNSGNLGTAEIGIPSGIYIDGAGDIYVSDAWSYTKRILEFPPNSTAGTYGMIKGGGNGLGSAANQLGNPQSVCVDQNGNIYVADATNYRIQKFPAGSTSATNGITVAGGNGQGSANNQIYPWGMCLDASGNIYVADIANDRILKFPPGSTSSTNGIVVAGGNGTGSAANQFFGPQGVFVDILGNIYVTDNLNSRIQKFPPWSTSATNGITVAGGNLGSTNSLNQPSGNVYVDNSGNIYISDVGNYRVQKWSQPLSGIDTSLIVTATGSYSAIVIDSLGCISLSDTLSVHSLNSPTTTISQNICSGNSVVFAGQYIQTPGTYVNTFSNNLGCDSIVFLNLSAIDTVTAFIALSPSSIPHLWYLTYSYSGRNASFLWSWGDGSPSSTGATPSHTYAAPGYYTICLTVTDSLGCSATYCDSNVHLFKNETDSMVYVNVVLQIPNGINSINADNLIIASYASAIHFSESIQTPTALKLYDLSGRVVQEQNNFIGKEWKLNAGLASGVYIIHLQNDGYSLSKKLLIVQ